MNSLEFLRLQEIHFAHRQSATSISDVWKYIEQPTIIKDKRILDIGSGASTTAMELQNAGAHPIAVDYLYSDSDKLTGSIQSFVDFLNEYPKSFKINEGRPMSLAEATHFTSFRNLVERSARDFSHDLVETPNIKYVAAVASALPFRDETFDLAYSTNCLSDYFSEPELFVHIVREVLRVLKKGKQLQIGPWQEDYFARVAQNYIPADIEKVYEILRIKGIPFRVQTVQKSDNRCLQIIKS